MPARPYSASMICFGFALTALLSAAPMRSERLAALEGSVARRPAPIVDGRAASDFPALLSPRFVSAHRARLAPDAFVFGCAIAGDAHAYALSLLDEHEIVNDVVGGQAIVATYCSLCNSGVVYDREIRSRTLTFRVAGKMWHNAQVMEDAETGSLWSHLTGLAIRGPLRGARLTTLAGGAAPRIAWADWRKRYPQTRVLSVNGREATGYDRYYTCRRSPTMLAVPYPEPQDTRLPAKAMVIGLTNGSAVKAYPHALLAQTPLLSDSIGNAMVLLVYDHAADTAAVFVSPEAGAFRRMGDVIVGPKGERWQAGTGRALTTHTSDLKPYPFRDAYWFGWSAHYPQTQVYAPGTATGK